MTHQPLLWALEACPSSKQDVIHAFIQLLKIYMFPKGQVHGALNIFLCEVLIWQSLHQKLRHVDMVCYMPTVAACKTFHGSDCATGCWTALCQVQLHLPCQR